MSWSTTYQTLRLIAVMIAAVTVLMVAHLAEVLVWSLIYGIFGVAPEGADIVYFAFVNYTTLGYGDVTPVERWHLLGPMTAMNGVLLFGWSTAVIFEVLRMTLLAGGEGRSRGGRSSARTPHDLARIAHIAAHVGLRFHRNIAAGGTCHSTGRPAPPGRPFNLRVAQYFETTGRAVATEPVVQAYRDHVHVLADPIVEYSRQQQD